MRRDDREEGDGGAWQKVVGTANLVEINLPVDGSPRPRIRVYICTYPTLLPSSPRFALLPTFHRQFPTVTPASPGPPRTSHSGKDRLINSAALVINSTPVKGREGGPTTGC